MTSADNATYTYNAQGLRVSKSVGNTTINFLLVGENVWVETTAAYLRGIELISNGTQLYLYNVRGDVIQLLNYDGTVAKEYDYDAYGNELQRNSNDSNPFRYCGEYYDTETGFIYLRARYYDPMVGRFTSVDPIKSGLNWYSYCDNNPVTRTDKTGEAWETIFDLLSLGGSIAEVCANPYDFWAWGGLVGDALDVAVPFLGGIGETIKALKYANKVMDVADDIVDAADTIHDVAKAADKIDDAVDTIHDASRAADKIEDSVKATSEIAEESTSKVLQKHHYATNKSKTYTHQFEEIVGKYKLDLDGDWNKEVLPHHGRHPNAYHEFVLEQVTEIDSIAGGNAKNFLDLFESNVKRVIRDNPDMLYKQYWRNLK